MKEEFDSIPVSGIRDAELALPTEVDGRWGVQINGPILGTDKKSSAYYVARCRSIPRRVS